MKRLFLITGALALLGFAADEPRVLPVEGDLEGVHDPAIMREGKTYYVFSTNGHPGNLIPIRCSEDLLHWTLCGHVFDALPEWAAKEIPGSKAPWAPDISFFHGKYHLYYAVSTFGKNDSAIGLATNRTLDPGSPDYHWVDEGMVVRSHQADDWNAIDPNLAIEDSRHLWLNWGSFWGGIKMRRIDPETGRLSAEDTKLYSLASRPRTGRVGGPVEAPFLVRHGGYWYLFVSFDYCCRGANSTYRVVAGRSKAITGPYMDRDGTPMMEGGGTPVISSSGGKWRGPGHEAVLQEPGGDYLVFHAYSAETGKSSLQISTLLWDQGWPRVGSLP
jgi:arabinan endo-1,5-alpha-L-arabinosidase